MQWTPRNGWCLGGSLLLHVLWVWGSEVGANQLPVSAAFSPSDHSSAWVGETFEIDTSEEIREGAVATPRGRDSPTESPSPVEQLPDAESSSHEPSSEPPPHIPPPLSDPERERSPDAELPASAPDGVREQTPSGRPPSTSEPARGQSAEASSPTTSGSGVSAGSFGAAGGKSGVRDLPVAFTRALPLAASRDRAWAQFSEGRWEERELRIELDEEGRISSSRWLGEEEVPSVLESLRRRTLSLLGGGQFALPLSKERSPVQLLKIQIHIEDRTPSEDAEEFETVQLGFEPPRATQIGEAFFLWGSGRKWSATVHLK